MSSDIKINPKFCYRTRRFNPLIRESDSKFKCRVDSGIQFFSKLERSRARILVFKNLSDWWGVRFLKFFNQVGLERTLDFYIFNIFRAERS